MAKRRMISELLGGSKKVGNLFKINKNLSEFSLNVYCLGIPHHDDYGQVTSDPWEWKTNIFKVSLRSEKLFKQAIDYLVEIGLFDISTCGKVLKYVNSENIQSLRGDRPLKNNFPGVKWQPRFTMVGQGKPLTKQVKLREVKLSKGEVEGEGDNQGKPPPPEITPEKLKSLWNENRGKCPEVKILTPDRRDKCNSRIKEQHTLAYWQTVCVNVKLSGFLQGLEINKDHPNWKANFDWLIDSGKNHVKVYEGNYSNQKKPVQDGAHPPEPKKEYKPPKPKKPKADSIWQLALEKLEKQIEPESFESWFAPTVGYDETGNKLLVAVPNQIFANWIPDHYAEMIQKALPDREVEFVVVPAMGK